ncbi:hypothetical protein A1O1_04763 [Capronia coronata CBS 617.96]|uniref:Uncharacterized protein n=1 Tax=Capronia coronata CBS 617.96 TaxID=1182541 RepID=W9YF32_9EURO|nr:uncharacterized protein A1O1_04763 [Capronia coronata CBS 617.96]EXJ87836.1 hypothetical protein A1O1_04763 [Capronia coronata CBS 617.96]
MPVYLVHGFRWPREGFSGIRVHAVVHNLDDCSVEYIQNENSRAEILASFRRAWPEIMDALDGPAFGTGGGGGGPARSNSKLEFIEQYNPDDLEGPNAVSQPYAYVADKVVMIAANPGAASTTTTASSDTITPTRVPQGVPASRAGGGAQSTPPKTPSKKPLLSPRTPTVPAASADTTTAGKSVAGPFNSSIAHDITALSINVDEVVAEGPGTSAKAWEAFADLRDKIAEGEKIGWWVVYNGDPDRSYNEDVDEDAEGDEYDAEMEVDGDEGMNYAGYRNENIQLQARQQQQQQPVARPRTAPGDNKAPGHRQPVPSSIPHIATQQQQQQQQRGLTALPVRPGPPTTSMPTARAQKGKQKESIPEPAKLKETAKSQGLRKKFFGKRL